MKKLFFLTAGLAMVFSACKKDIAGSVPWTAYSNASYSQVFEAFWTGMNTNYVWWSEDSVDWDAKYTFYKPVFDQLNIDNPADQLTSIGYFRGMVAGLIDSHYYISFSDSLLKNTVIDPAKIRKMGKIDPVIPQNYFFDTLFQTLDQATRQRGYLNFSNTTEQPGTTLSERMILLAGTIDQSLIYFHFNLCYVYKYRDTSAIQAVMTAFRALLSNPSSGYKGLILDMRSNSGGELSDLQYVAGNLISQGFTFGYTRQKSGPNRLDYTPWNPVTFSPAQAGIRAFTKPIVVLTDQNTISMAEQTTMALRLLPNTYVIGDTTWGATGPLNQQAIQDFNGGEFFFANSFGFVYTSSVQFKCGNGNIYEGKGFPPDEYVHLIMDSLYAGDDIQLNAAKKYLNAH